MYVDFVKKLKKTVDNSSRVPKTYQSVSSKNSCCETPSVLLHYSAMCGRTKINKVTLGINTAKSLRCSEIFALRSHDQLGHEYVQSPVALCVRSVTLVYA